MLTYIENLCSIQKERIALEVNISRRDVWFLIVCLGLGFLAEYSFLHGIVGVSYPIFLAGFYIVVFLRFKYSFHHRRIGLLLMVCIWILSANFLFYDISFLHGLNILLIPALVFAHLVLITSSTPIQWGKPKFLIILLNRLVEAYQYIFLFIKTLVARFFAGRRKKSHQTFAKILLGILIAGPVLFVVILLLMSADTMFENLIMQLPDFMLSINIELLFRSFIILFVGFLFFGVFQVLGHKPRMDLSSSPGKFNFSDISAITILILLNIVYIVFVTLQFTYFFNGNLMEGYTYAEYARRGFFELLIVLIINWTILISFLKFVHSKQRILKITFQSLSSLLIGMSGIMLVSAFMRLMMYEEAYGFTLSRVLAHGFMIYLIVIFAYTFIRIWLEKLPLLHFYVIVGIVFYAGINGMNLEQFIVNKNIERYEETGKIDVHYLRDLSAIGMIELIALYEKDPEIEDLEYVIISEQEYVKDVGKRPWQSYNFARERMEKELRQFKVRGDY